MIFQILLITELAQQEPHLDDMFDIKRVFKNFLSLSAAQIISKAFGFCAVIYLARTLGAENFGKISFAQAIVSYFLLFCNLGLDTYGIMEVSRNKGENLQNHINCIFTIEFFASILSFILLVILVLLIPKPYEIKLLILILGFNLFAFAITIDWYFMGLERMGIIAIARICRGAFYFLLIILIIKKSDQVIYFSIIDSITKFVLALILLLFFLSKGNKIRFNFNSQAWRNTIKQSLPIGLSLIMAMLYHNIDTVMLGFLKGEKVVGWYNAAYRIADTILILPTIIVQVSFPLLAKSLTDRESMKKSAHGFIKTMFYLGLPIGFGGFIIAPSLIQLLYGSEYYNSVAPLQILCWNVAIIFMNTSFNRTLTAWNKQHCVMKSIACGALVNLIGNILLIPKYHIIGAAIATLMAEISVLIYSFFVLKKEIGAYYFKYLFRPLLNSTIMFLLLLSLSIIVKNVFILIIFGITVYFGLSFFKYGINDFFKN